MSTDTTARPRIGFIGAGRSGRVLALALHRADYPVVAIASRRLESAMSLAQLIPGCRAAGVAQEVVHRADLVFLTVPDDSIVDVAESLAWRTGIAAIHCSGAGSLSLLDAAALHGAAIGTFHPLQTLADTERGLANLPGSTFAIESETPSLRATLGGMAERLDGQPLFLRPGEKILYHASAVLAANCLVALADVAADLWTHLGSTRDEGLVALLPLMRGAIANLGSIGLPDALTGPIARGDAGTVEQHLAALRVLGGDAPEVYRALARRTIQLAQERGGIDPETVKKLSALLDELPPAQGGDPCE